MTRKELSDIISKFEETENRLRSLAIGQYLYVNDLSDPEGRSYFTREVVSVDLELMVANTVNPDEPSKVHMLSSFELGSDIGLPDFPAPCNIKLLDDSNTPDFGDFIIQLLSYGYTLELRPEGTQLSVTLKVVVGVTTHSISQSYPTDDRHLGNSTKMIGLLKFMKEELDKRYAV